MPHHLWAHLAYYTVNHQVPCHIIDCLTYTITTGSLVVVIARASSLAHRSLADRQRDSALVQTQNLTGNGHGFKIFAPAQARPFCAPLLSKSWLRHWLCGRALLMQPYLFFSVQMWCLHVYSEELNTAVAFTMLSHVNHYTAHALTVLTGTTQECL